MVLLKKVTKKQHQSYPVEIADTLISSHFNNIKFTKHVQIHITQNRLLVDETQKPPCKHFQHRIWPCFGNATH